jgi:adenine-specific DNA-methyltransferase
LIAADTVLTTIFLYNNRKEIADKVVRIPAEMTGKGLALTFQSFEKNWDRNRLLQLQNLHISPSSMNYENEEPRPEGLSACGTVLNPTANKAEIDYTITMYVSGRMGVPPLSSDAKTDEILEKKEYLCRQLITYIGNKRSLLDFIESGIKKVQKKINKTKLRMFDAFSGSGIVARFFKRFSDLLIVNDLEKYSAVINGCYLANQDELDIALLRNYYQEIIEGAGGCLTKGIISEMYAPQNDAAIKPGERVFFTSRNAMYIDTVRQLIDKIPENERKYFLAPLLSEASVHANTSGVFKGFYKNKETGIGQFGGINRSALFRITGNIKLPFPIFSNFSCDTMILNDDVNRIVKELPEVDVAYLDPPYNQHPYGSNYFMLNLIVDYMRPENVSKISGIPENWNRSRYNIESHALRTLAEIVENIKARYVLISFNSEGFIGLEEMKNMLMKFGRVEVLETKYNTFRGSRNLNSREIYITEYLYLLEK